MVDKLLKYNTQHSQGQSESEHLYNSLRTLICDQGTKLKRPQGVGQNTDGTKE